jgi:hypothetical protein
MTITFLNFGDKLGLLGQAAKGDGWAAAKVAQEANMAPISIMYAKQTVGDASNYWNAFKSGNLAGHTKNVYASGMQSLFSGTSTATCYRAFPSATVQRFLPGVVKSLDKSLLETGVGRGVLSRLGGSATFAKTATGASATISGGAAAQVGGKAMARIPVLGILISAAFEIPDIIDAFKNGDGMQQLGRSACKVAGATAGAAIGGALGSFLGPIGTLVGSAVGGWLGHKVGGFIGNALFGKSIKDKMHDGDYARNIMQSYNNLNFNNIGSGQSVYGGQVGNYGNATGNYGMGGGPVDVNATLAYVNEGLARLGGI